MKKVYKLTPALRDCIWGGKRLAAYGKATASDRLGESWELSFVPDAQSRVDGVEVSEVFDRASWGERCKDFKDFPVLTKFIDACDSLSVQVHPSDEYALKHEGQYGKTEMWYIVEAEDGAGIYMGLREKCTAEQFARAVTDGTVEELLEFKRVQPSDVFFIPSGTVHAIGKGVLLFEIQQNSTLTYRLYDYMRRDKNGNMRELHIDKAMKVAHLEKYEPVKISSDDPSVIGTCPYFTARLHRLRDGSIALVSDGSFISFTCITGSGTADGEPFSRGESFFIPAGAGRVEIFGNCDIISVSL